MKRWLPHPALSLFLTILWVLLVNDLGLGQWLLGAVLGWLIPLICRPFLPQVPQVRKPLALFGFALRVLGDIITANLQVARLVVGPRSHLHPAFVEIPLEVQDEFLITALASIISLTPGTVSAALSEDRRTLLVHGLDVPDPQALVREVKTRYEAPLLEIFACSTT